MKIIIASHNKDKIREFREIIGDPRIQLISMREAGFTEEIPEPGHSYAENAEIKARAVFNALGGRVLADDSGLSVDALGGYPGIYSARFAGEHTAYKEKCERLWALLRDVPEESWTAAFHCALCYIDLSGSLRRYERQVPGRIIRERRGENGFGYDPIFYLEDRCLTNAELPTAEKNARSHRGLALRDWYHDIELELKAEEEK